MAEQQIWKLRRDGEDVYFLPRYYGPNETGRERKPVEPVIAGFDTESAICSKCGRYEPISIQAAVLEADPRRQKDKQLFEWVPCGADPFEQLMAMLVRLVGRRKRPVYMGAHNLGYDLGQLFKGDPSGYLMLRGGLPADFDPGAPGQKKRQKVYVYKPYKWAEVEFRALVPNSSAPFAEIHLSYGSQVKKNIGGREAIRWQMRRWGRVKQERVDVTEWGRTVEINLRDTSAFVKSSLEAACKAFGLDVRKLHHPPALGVADYRPHTPDHVLKRQVVTWIKEQLALPEDQRQGSTEEWEEWKLWLFLTGAQMRQKFEDYGQVDALAAAQLLAKLWDMQQHYGAKDPAVSAPSFSAGRIRELGREVGLYTGMGGADAIQAAIEAYKGGRIGGVYQGAVERIYGFDLQSSYPYAMLFLPSFSPDHGSCYRVDPETDPDPDLRTSLALTLAEEYPCTILQVTGLEANTRYPAFLARQEILTEHGQKRSMLVPQAGQVEGCWVTGAELLAALANGFELERVDYAYSWYDAKPGLSPFAKFVNQFYHEKQTRGKDDPLREMAKLALNAAYGKLIEMRRPDRMGLIYPLDSGVFLVSPYEREGWAGRYYWKVIEAAMAEGITDEAGISERLHQASAELEQKLQQAGQDYEVVALPELPISDGHFGSMAIPPAAATVTGIARARLLLGMNAVDALYWATDSLFTTLQPDQAREALARIPETTTTRWGTFRTLPKGVKPPQLGKELGDLEEDTPAMYGVFAGLGRYWLEPVDKTGDPKKDKPKFAVHGLPHLDKKRPQLVKEVLETLARGEIATYMGKPHPVKARGTTPKRSRGKRSRAPEEIGRFVAERYEAAPEFDPRLEWVQAEGENHFNGRYWTQMEYQTRQEVAASEAAEKWERKQEQRQLHGEARARAFRAAWIRNVGRVSSRDFDQADIPTWCRAAKGSRATGLDELVGGAALPDPSGQMRHPLHVLGDHYPGWIDTEEQLLRLLWENTPAKRQRPAKEKKAQLTIFIPMMEAAGKAGD